MRHITADHSLIKRQKKLSNEALLKTAMKDAIKWQNSLLTKRG